MDNSISVWSFCARCSNFSANSVPLMASPANNLIGTGRVARLRRSPGRSTYRVRSNYPSGRSSFDTHLRFGMACLTVVTTWAVLAAVTLVVTPGAYAQQNPTLTGVRTIDLDGRAVRVQAIGLQDRRPGAPVIVFEAVPAIHSRSGAASCPRSRQWRPSLHTTVQGWGVPSGTARAQRRGT